MPYTESEPEEITPTLEGVWLHLESDPIGTALHLRYGKASRSREVEVSSQGTHYAGRRYPVMDIGESETDRVRVSTVVAHGQDYSSTMLALIDFARARVPIRYRDNRGRSMVGLMSSYQESDAEYGSVAAFQFNRSE